MDLRSVALISIWFSRSGEGENFKKNWISTLPKVLDLLPFSSGRNFDFTAAWRKKSGTTKTIRVHIIFVPRLRKVDGGGGVLETDSLVTFSTYRSNNVDYMPRVHTFSTTSFFFFSSTVYYYLVHYLRTFQNSTRVHYETRIADLQINIYTRKFTTSLTAPRTFSNEVHASR